MARKMHPNSLANLKPAWRAGESGNSAGRTAGAAFVSEWINSLLAEAPDGEPKYTRKEIERIAKRDTSPARVMAAREILCAMGPRERYVKDKHGKVYQTGTDPEPGRAFDRTCNRLDGKPKATMEIQRKPEQSLGEIEDQLVGVLRAQPALLDETWVQLKVITAARRASRLRDKLLPLIEYHRPELVEALKHPIIDTTAEELRSAGG